MRNLAFLLGSSKNLLCGPLSRLRCSRYPSSAALLGTISAPLATVFLGLLLALICGAGNAQEVYKWTDENGKVHFSDRSAAPADSKKITVKVAPPSDPAAGQDKQKATSKQASSASPRAHAGSAKESVPVDPGKVGSRCMGLIDQIAKVKPGTPWGALYNDFDQACPGIAYECVNYKSRPEKNTCTWVERTGGNVLHTKNYP